MAAPIVLTHKVYPVFHHAKIALLKIFTSKTENQMQLNSSDI